jgi:anthranilate synthase component 1
MNLGCPEALLMIPSAILIFDHRLRTLKIVLNAFLEDGEIEKVYSRAVESINEIARNLAQPSQLPLVPITEDEPHRPYQSNFEPEDFRRAVNRAKEYILAGDIFQVVLSQRFESSFNGTPLDFYRCLRFINPSPYMFCLNFGGDFSLVGSSPEMHVRLTGDIVEIRPIAGDTRARPHSSAR